METDRTRRPLRLFSAVSRNTSNFLTVGTNVLIFRALDGEGPAAFDFRVTVNFTPARGVRSNSLN